MAEKEDIRFDPPEKVSFELRSRDIATLREEVVKGRIVEAALQGIDPRAKGWDFSLTFGLHWGKEQTK